MSTMILGTSVAVAWYLPEAYSREARAWRDRFLAGHVKFVAPSLHFWELANVLRTYVRRGELADSLASDIYEAHLDAGIETLDPERWNVLRVALKYEATVYDAVYIALSLEREMPLLTAEKTTTPWVVKLGRLVETVRAGDGIAPELTLKTTSAG
jgi:predicted nucleic acid-binding protein